MGVEFYLVLGTAWYYSRIDSTTGTVPIRFWKISAPVGIGTLR